MAGIVAGDVVAVNGLGSPTVSRSATPGASWSGARLCPVRGPGDDAVGEPSQFASTSRATAPAANARRVPSRNRLTPPMTRETIPAARRTAKAASRVSRAKRAGPEGNGCLAAFGGRGGRHPLGISHQAVPDPPTDRPTVPHTEHPSRLVRPDPIETFAPSRSSGPMTDHPHARPASPTLGALRLEGGGAGRRGGRLPRGLTCSS